MFVEDIQEVDSGLNPIFQRLLHNRQGDAIDLLVDVEGVDISHTTYIVYHSHQAGFEVIAMDVVLTAEPLDELLAMEFLGMDSRVDKCLHQCFHDLVTA